MPNMDGTGPVSRGSRMGYGRRICFNNIGCRYGRGVGYCRVLSTNNKQVLEAEKAFLEDRISLIDKRLSNL